MQRGNKAENKESYNHAQNQLLGGQDKEKQPATPPLSNASSGIGTSTLSETSTISPTESPNQEEEDNENRGFPSMSCDKNRLRETPSTGVGFFSELHVQTNMEISNNCRFKGDQKKVPSFLTGSNKGQITYEEPIRNIHTFMHMWYSEKLIHITNLI